jgi:mono/diheme cytochrome c family protein
VTRRGALAVLALATAALVAGCGAVGRSTAGDASNGKALFSAHCASCHVLADAKAQGKIGPSLDDAFESVRMKDIGSFDESTIRDVVRGQIAYAEEPMPQNIVVGEDADDVAAYVAKCAGVRACGVQASNPSPPSTGGGGGGGGGGGNLAEGKKIFASAGCTSCHTLKDAGSTGNVGPNLDQAKPSKTLAVQRVTNGKGPMPPFKGQLTDAQIAAVATYVSSVAGK